MDLIHGDKMRIKFGEVKINDLSRKHLDDCLNNHQVTMGPKTKLLEDKWCGLFNYKHTVALSSGTAACMAANMSLYDFGAQPGDEVICPALSFIATANSIRAAGFKPIFCDVKEDLMIDEKLIESLITPRTKAIMPVTLMGKPPRMDVIRDIADRHGLVVIVDDCEAHGCTFQGKFMGDWGDIAVYSCYAAHILFSGEMGLLATNNSQIAEAVESIRSHGRQPGSLYFDHLRYGLNLKPTDVHASIGLGTVDDFWDIFVQRKYNWTFLRDKLAKYEDIFWLSDQDDDAITSPHGFSLTVKPGVKINVNDLKKAFDDAGIDWKRNFGAMPTQHCCFSYLGHKLGDFPKAEYIGDNGVHIGVHYYLTQEDLEKIVTTINNLCS